MRILITGAAGNLGGMLSRYLLAETNHFLNLMTHEHPVDPTLNDPKRTKIYKCDLEKPGTLKEACANSEVIIHFAGLLFAPKPAEFLPTTNTVYAQHLIDAAITEEVKRFILVSFPHVEGPTSKEKPCTDRLDRKPISIHAQTRLAAEKYLFEKASGTQLRAISLRPGMIYGKDVLMISFAKKLAQRRLLGVWQENTLIHILSIDDFLSCCKAAIEKPDAKGIYPLGDDSPTTLQAFLETCCKKWDVAKPWRMPLWLIYSTAWAAETYARVFGTRTPLTADFIRIGKVPYFCDTTRMKRDLLRELKYPSLEVGKEIL